MPKGYVIGRIDVIDPEKYAAYVPLATAAMKAHGGTVLTRGGLYEALEGPSRARNVIVEFPSLAAATAYFHSPEYTLARDARAGAAHVEIVAVEGV
ncbi:DUF1330 domain-containing protein [Aquabacter cavernae]|uniref:DUF1330 domain-containing protein n=1 Tax=Aquabacter cavernae TaxID=2496029 RepID=UPI000F8CE158|nr:DUF1330 domain-containing protein [Aquabacter cavernae]